MNNYPNVVKNNLLSIIEKMAAAPENFVVDPDKNFTRNRKLSFASTMCLMLSMGGNSIQKELHEFFNYSKDTLSTSGFYQHRKKLSSSAFEFLLSEFTKTLDKPKTHKGYRLLAVDGTDLNIYHNPKDSETYIRHRCNEKGYNSLHFTACYDLLNKLFLDGIVQPGMHMNEYRASVNMVDRSNISGDVILIADRGFESYNVFGHITEKGWKYVIRAKDVTSNGIAKALKLPDSDEFDTTSILKLTRKQTKVVKTSTDIYRFLPQAVPFDYLNSDNECYTLAFRVLRLKIAEGQYETIMTNLDESSFSASDIKELYGIRWGIETSFRELKYAIGLTSFHSKKVSYITQEIFARLVMYNFCEMITMQVIVTQGKKKHIYQVNFTVAIDICRKLFRCREDEPPPHVNALISKNILPIRKGRSFPRNIRRGRTISFTYRVA